MTRVVLDASVVVKWFVPEGAGTAEALAGALETMPVRVEDPAPSRIARWVATGLTAYDATYVALAEATGCRVVTTDAQMLAAAPALTVALA